MVFNKGSPAINSQSPLWGIEAHYFLINGPASRKGRWTCLFPHAKRTDKWWYFGCRATAACRETHAVGFGCTALGFTLWLFKPAVRNSTGQGSNRCTVGRREETQDKLRSKNTYSLWVFFNSPSPHCGGGGGENSNSKNKNSNHNTVYAISDICSLFKYW